ncbi:family 10 glycosylhydrolase [Tolypothrix sp. PCC 7910]|uniref:glycoside hydrolase family 10 protein n=1 Tax=Tolypothrix sp. PCC 7910 TaxID=2099387 RepID=UPI0014278888|nr:glycoside hydrolase family 10 protein [Tolypothrix sp. PCC 7910]QIR41053.1 family 10 glycosylhydrolase [Tolypothrix sp. PCC 7910]
MFKKLGKWVVNIGKWKIWHQKKQALFAMIVTLSMVATMMLSFPLNAQTPPARSLATELRGVWLTNIDSDVLFERDRLKKSLQRLSELNFNTVYPTVWNWGYTLYPSQVAAKVIGRSLDPTPGLQGRDMLKEVVEEGHKKGLTVIPWFEFGFMAPADSQLAKRYPQWLTNRSNGTRIVKEGTHDRVWLSPFRPDVQQFMQDLIVEIVKNYNIDGIQFDDHFGLPSELGYDPYTVALYKKEHGGRAPSRDFKDPEWVAWRANKITDYMKRVFTAIKAVKKDCIVSVAPNPQRFSYDFFLADWQKWERLGLVEDLVLQIYRDDLSRFIRELEYPEVKAARSHIPVSIGILSGLKGKSISMQQIQTQVQKVRDRNFAGVSFFFYETLWNMSQEKPLDRQTSFGQMFPTRTAYPNLLAGWKP